METAPTSAEVLAGTTTTTNSSDTANPSDHVEAHLGSDLPDIKLIASGPQSEKPKQLKPKLRREIPRTALNSVEAVKPVEALLAGMFDYSDDVKNTSGKGSRRLVTQAVGVRGQVETDWEDYEEPSKVSARWVFHREVLRLFGRALDVASTADAKFDAQVGVGSPAFGQIKDLAQKVVHSFIENVSLIQRKPNPFLVGPMLVREGEMDRFDNALHAGYDGLNNPERAFARALDKTGQTWFRNPPRSGFNIPLISVGETDNFYPDFVLWTDTDVVCIDTKGPHILREDAGRKLLSVRPRTDGLGLLIRFVTAGEYTPEMVKQSADGFTIWGLKDDGTRRAQHFGTLEEVIENLSTARVLV